MSDWYSKRLGVTPPIERGGIVVPAPQPVQNFPVHAPPPAPPEQVGNAGTGVPAQPKEGASFSEYLAGRGQTRGGEAQRTDGGRHCPSCGSANFFSQAQGSNAVYNANTGQAATPTPQCYECGYNERFQQADKSNWAT
jgi:hypothetical protein